MALLLSPEQFCRLSEYSANPTLHVKEMLDEFQQGGKYYPYISSNFEDQQAISFEGVRIFLQDYFADVLPAEMLEQLFLSFYKPEEKERRTSLLEDAFNTMRYRFTENLQSLAGRLERFSLMHLDSLGSSSSGSGVLSSARATNSLSARIAKRLAGHAAAGKSSSLKSAIGIPNSITDTERLMELYADLRIPLKPLICTLSLLEADTPENKLEVVFHVYDSDANGYLDKAEIDSIIDQMMTVARYKQWDTTELEEILRQMMSDIDYDSDGIVSLEEWKHGGMTNIPLLVLLGLDTSLQFAEMKEDGNHVWRLRHFSKPNYCNACCSLLVGWGGKQGLSCSLCKYTVHEKCVRTAANNCIKTFSVRTSNIETLYHHWQDANTAAKCVKCNGTVGAFQGKRCRWCHNYVHHRCMSSLPHECDMGALAYHMLPPTHIFPAFLERKSCSHKNFQPNCNNLLQAISPGPNSHPLLVLVNPKSGGKQGIRILQKFAHILNPRQVYDLSKFGPEPGLDLFSAIPNCNILVCGGDGTIGWVLESMDKINFPHGRPPVAILPLGTGNDLARCLRWGGGYENESLHKILDQIEHATTIQMDRWQIKIESTDKGTTEEKSWDHPPYAIVNNYFSIGVDASIAHRFHVMRETHPEKFNSRMRNKLWYFELGTTETLSASCKNLHEQIDILCDGESVDIGQETSLEGIALLNIHSIYGGSNLWGNSRKRRLPGILPLLSRGSTHLNNRVQDIGDGLIEVVGLESAIQMGQIKAGVRDARRLSQCATVVIQTHKAFPMQIDGEPWMQPPCIIQITHKNQVNMLMAPKKRTTWWSISHQTQSEDN
ncbi:unnamed protein product [Auanema sp. JU1783]|nr:unnamed protein product [Auanema sp. JU1783]